MVTYWWTDENGETNTRKIEIIIDRVESLRTINEDNSEFKKELVTITGNF